MLIVKIRLFHPKLLAQFRAGRSKSRKSSARSCAHKIKGPSRSLSSLWRPCLKMDLFLDWTSRKCKMNQLGSLEQLTGFARSMASPWSKTQRINIDFGNTALVCTYRTVPVQQIICPSPTRPRSSWNVQTMLSSRAKRQ